MSRGLAAAQISTLPAGHPEARQRGIKPGGHVGIHSHKDRPSVVYFVQGTDTVTREDGTSHTFHPGDTTAEPGTTVHWHKNDGKDDAIFVAVDVLKKETPK